MGTWAEGVLDNDAAHDGLGDLTHKIVEDIVAFGAESGSSAALDRLAAAVGTLLQLSAFEFSEDSDHAGPIRDAVAAHAAGIEKLAPPARDLLLRVKDGGGEALAERAGMMDVELMLALRQGNRESPFGLREPALFRGEAAAAYVQSLADFCCDLVDEDFSEEDNWSDLCREAYAMGLLGVLLVLEPCRVDVDRIASWRVSAQTGLETLREADDEELAFHEAYHANLDRVLAGLIQRYRP